MSRLFHRAPLRAAMSFVRGSCFGMTKMQSVAMGMHTSATNQNTHDHDANWTNIAPMIRPRTIGNPCQRSGHAYNRYGKLSPLPTAPQPPKTPMARACSVGSVKTFTRSVKADGMVMDAAMPHKARRTINGILLVTKPAAIDSTPRPDTPPMNANSEKASQRMPGPDRPRSMRKGTEGRKTSTTRDTHDVSHNKRRATISWGLRRRAENKKKRLRSAES